jgi:hypothetical protein
MPSIVDFSTKREGDCALNSRNGVAVFEETYYYIVQGDYIGQSYAEIISTPGLPALGSTGPSGVTACTGRSANRRPDAALYWDVTCTFSSEVQENQGDNPTQDPVAWVPVYETKFERIQEAVIKDQSGDVVDNSAGQVFPEGLIITRLIPVWEFWQFEPATVTDEEIIERTEVVNSATFRGRAAKTLLCVVMSSVLGFYYGQRRRLTQYQLKYNEKDWTHKRRDTGTYYLDGSDKKAYLDADGNIINGPLNGSGAQAATASILSFDIYATNDFSFLRV